MATQSQLTKILQLNRRKLAQALIAGIDVPRENRFLDPPDVFEARTIEAVNLLIGHLEGRQNFDALYVGQRAMELIQPELTREKNLTACRRSVEQDLQIYREFLRPRIGADQMSTFERGYSSATLGLTTQAKRHVRTLFVGDCLMAEIASFVLGPLAAEGISIDPFPINSKDTAGLRRTLDLLATKQYDVIFFSPFSHSRIPEIEFFSNPKNAFSGRSELDAITSSIIDQTRALMDYLASKFECPIFVHNGAFLQRSQSAMKSAIGLITNSRATSYARTRINQWLADYVALHNSTTFQHIFIIDEDGLASQFGRSACGKFLYSSAWQHATVLSQKLAELYRSRISTVANLVGKKLVICDLDNTLWDGIIGEGAVSHFAHRQKTLKALKDFGGVVLSIASKNDPNNVHFREGVLAHDDFVCPQISWGAKADAIARIKKTLNLQTKHMVFVDDRPDERALVHEAFPDILTLDACDPQTWLRMEIWSHLVHGSSDVDRTRLYQEQVAREAATVPDDDARESVNKLKNLGLVITIEHASKRDLKRVVELINRTNQWNLCGTKTSFEQVKGWNDSDNSHVLIASAADRFGEMGTVCVAIVKVDRESVEIPVFVLSCRVFGYGVETAMLGEIQRSLLTGGKRLIGHFRATTQNHLCKSMYIDHGFTVDGDLFVWSGALILNPEWTEVRLGSNKVVQPAL
jgi:FkbH-like protein